MTSQDLNPLPKKLPENNDRTFRLLSGKKAAVFLDYDGTLTPIVDDPAAATMSEDMRQVVHNLARKCKVAIVSGRDLNDVRNFVQLDHVYYAGSHGFDIQGPDGMGKKNEQGLASLPDLDKAQRELEEKIGLIPGIGFERKGFALAVHYRNVDEEKIAQIEEAVSLVNEKYDKLRRSWGKKIFELQPNVDWHKGKAVIYLLDVLELNSEDVIPFYIGDDLTDEDAFTALPPRGIGIYVGRLDRPTAAGYYIKDTDEVKTFLQQLGKQL
jgi:alpha,alpha-trehalase